MTSWSATKPGRRTLCTATPPSSPPRVPGSVSFSAFLYSKLLPLRRAATRRAVDSAVLNRAEYDSLLQSAGTKANGVFLFTAEHGPERATVYSRMFAPDLGVVEDPATGSASGPLGCYLVRHKIVKAEKAGAMVSLQGVKMGRPSQIHISIGIHGNDISSVQVGGASVLAGEGTLYV